MEATIDTTSQTPPIANKVSKVRVRDLNFFYGGYHALTNVNLDIADKRITAFIGPSGCG